MINQLDDQVQVFEWCSQRNLFSLDQQSSVQYKQNVIIAMSNEKLFSQYKQSKFAMQMQQGSQILYAQDGLAKIRQRFGSVLPQLPDIVSLPGQLIETFKNVKLKNPTQKVTSRYNIAVLIQWLISDITELNSEILRIDSSQLSVALLLMKFMEKNQLLKAIDSQQIKQVNSYLEQVLKEKVEEVNRKCLDYLKIKRDGTCRFISQNTIKSKDNLLRKAEQIIKDNKPLSPLAQMDLNCVFSNILLNLRRIIKVKSSEKSSEIISVSKKLDIIKIKSYYLTIATFIKTQKYVQQLSGNILNSNRKVTYVHLLYDEKGLPKIYKYFEQAPLQQLNNDMDFISQTINKKQTK